MTEAKTTNAPTEWRNRIVAHGEVKAVDLVAHPQNWRKHPKEQATRLQRSLGGVGWVQDVIVNQRTGRMLDGHLRAEMARAQGEATPVPVVYVDLSEDEERLVLASLDPIAGMAVTDAATLAALVRSIDDADLRSVADDIAEALNVVAPKADEWGAAFAGVPNEDRAPFQQMTFTLHDTQAEQVKQALSIAGKLGDFTDSPNENSNGNALAFICETFITEHGQS